ncbi:Protein YcgL [Photobacterium marinum]|uniref:YcgL domain-containing protein C942_01295 n=1 Tax=Photobacterium marinum TaxID=1056511 RepID=L8JIU3_9GAMM|nr:YcgL domain-containing protein [Photobacterium marinum]ELR67367.1 Protein YcgL [Photobacterium marinum]
MFCAIYKSPKKENTYLYINNKDDFSQVPKSLMATFGTPQFVMVLNLDNGRKLALADVDKVKDALATAGFYLQVPPPVTNLLDEYKASMAGNNS